MDKLKKVIHLLFNIVLFFVLANIVYAWMVTTASSGEIVSYRRDLIVSNVDLDVKLYKMFKEQYYEVDDEIIALDYMAPNDQQFFKFTVTNNGTSKSTARIIIGGFGGDLNLLKDKIYLGVVGSKDGMKKLSDNLEYNEDGNYNYLLLTDDILVEGGETQEIEWYIYVDKNASNEIANAVLSIDSINFIKP